MTIVEALQKKQLLFDGAMGTQLQKRGLPIGGQPEYFNLTHPEVVQEIFEEYVAAGADVVTTNTFQANATKIPSEELPTIIETAVKIARLAHPRFVAYDMGPIGQLMAPMGTLTFDRSYELFKEQALLAEQAGADVVILETMADLLETKTAILAIKENTSLPVFATLTYQEDGRTFVGTDPLTATLTLQGLGVDALGVNCSLGPKELLPVVETILSVAKIPVMVQANAGLPEMENGQTVYRISVKEYTTAVSLLLEKGVRIVGGCCGTTPEFIKNLREVVDKQPLVQTVPKTVTALTSGLETVIIDDKLTLIGERINPTGKKKLKEALRNKDLAYILKEAIAQKEAGADILDVNVGLPEIDEAAMMTKVVQELQGLISLPLQIDSSDVSAIEAGVRYYNGRPLINSVNGKQSSMEAIFPIAKKYGGVVLGLCLDASGIPETAEKRLAIAEKIVKTAENYGIGKESVMIDPLVLTASAQQEQVQVTLETLRLLKQKLGVHTVVGLSNVSFGLPNRELLNGAFLANAVGAGLDAPIMNPLSDFMMSMVRSLKVFNHQDVDSTNYIAHEQHAKISVGASSEKNDKATQTNGETLDLKQMILSGRKELTATETKRLLETLEPLTIVNEFFIPALDEVGRKFEAGTLFLPQLMQSAEAVKNAQEILKERLLKEGAKAESQGKILLATVEGDIHDIGKNIVKMILENYGFDIVDLGKDVSIDEVVATVRAQEIQLVGLSALMTTTVQNMKATIQAVRKADLTPKFMVGGAVLNEEYRDFVGADYYAKDALEAVSIAQKVFK